MFAPISINFVQNGSFCFAFALHCDNCHGTTERGYAKHEIGCVNALLNVWLISSAKMCTVSLMQRQVLFFSAKLNVRCCVNRALRFWLFRLFEIGISVISCKWLKTNMEYEISGACVDSSHWDIFPRQKCCQSIWSIWQRHNRSKVCSAAVHCNSYPSIKVSFCIWPLSNSSNEWASLFEQCMFEFLTRSKISALK